MEIQELFPPEEHITLTDGKTYRLQPATLRSMAYLEKHYGKPFYEILKTVDLHKAEELTVFLWAVLRQSNKDFTEDAEYVLDHLRPSQYTQTVNLVNSMLVSGLPTDEQREAAEKN